MARKIYFLSMIKTPYLRFSYKLTQELLNLKKAVTKNRKVVIFRVSVNF